MDKLSSLLITLVLPFLISFTHLPLITSTDLQTYIVQVEKPLYSDGNPYTTEDLRARHLSFLPTESRLVHSYDVVFSGFAAKLSSDEAKNLTQKPGFVRILPNRNLSFLTTHTPKFLGLQKGKGIWNSSQLGKGIIIGMIDGGVKPTHPSFNDHGIPPPPPKWKGECNFDKGCNNKLIGGVNYIGSDPRDLSDDDGHGTHTSTTAAGNFVEHANISGMATGTASGMAPHAHLVIYKAIDSAGIYAAFETAIEDGVDILSISIGTDGFIPLYNDEIAIGSFAAVSKGIVVVCAGGNDGPEASTVINAAPWVITVGADTVDRRIGATLKLGDGYKFRGETISFPKGFVGRSFPLFYSKKPCHLIDSADDLKGKLVVCKALSYDSDEVAPLVKQAGGLGIIFIDREYDGYSVACDSWIEFPFAVVPFDVGSKIISYATSKDKPTISIVSVNTMLGATPAPIMAAFSSRGPSLETKRILKPDISAPGVDILAAWAGIPRQFEKEMFIVFEGTSMATPHVSGIAAILRSLHPEWSPAAIKSAIMTTSDDKDNTGGPIKDHMYKNASFFAMGAGHVNPTKASNPGLIYDLNREDYIGFLCNMYDKFEFGSIVHDPEVDCDKMKKVSQSELNYPAIGVALRNRSSISVSRTVTNVGQGRSAYKVEVDISEKVSVKVHPEILEFSEVNEKRKFRVTISEIGRMLQGVVEGNLRWISGEHVVRSPIIVFGGK